MSCRECVQVSWLTETDLMTLLLERLGPGFPPDAQKHAAEILAAVARSQVLPGRDASPDPGPSLFPHPKYRPQIKC